MYGLKQDWCLAPKARHFVLDDYVGGVPRWCPGCGDTSVLNTILRLMRDEQLVPEKTVVVSGIGCSSRFPHYVKTYGFHSLHGRAFPVACGVKSRRPDVNVFVATGDGDCCAIGAGHWVHAIRYNMNMTVMLFDNNIYGLTKMQTSPTTDIGLFSNTHPRGSWLSAMNPLQVVLGITNCSFVAQTIDWNPAHLSATMSAAHKHQGLSFVRILTRCPHYMSKIFDPLQEDPGKLLLMHHDEGVQLEPMIKKFFPNQVEHDPSDINQARELVGKKGSYPIGLFYRNENAERYDLMSIEGLGMGASEKVEAMNKVMDKFLV